MEMIIENASLGGVGSGPTITYEQDDATVTSDSSQSGTCDSSPSEICSLDSHVAVEGGIDVPHLSCIAPPFRNLRGCRGACCQRPLYPILPFSLTFFPAHTRLRR